MKNKFLYIILISLVACNDFGDMNIDPNNPTVVAPSGLLTNAIHGMAPTEQALTGLFYAQYWSQTRYTSESRYNVSQFDFTNYYSGARDFDYSGVLRDLDEVIRLNSDPETMEFASKSGSNNNQIAVARILRAYYYNHITDRWGDIPYTEAFRFDEEHFTPAYDPQEQIYTDLFTELKEAIDQFDSGPAPIGDVLYNGDLEKWEKFANSLRLRMAMRISEANPTKAQNEFVSAYNDGVFDTIADNATYQYLGDGNFDTPAYGYYSGGRIDYAVSNTTVDFLKQRNDPRIEAYADPTKNKLPQNKYFGMPYGLTEGQAGTFAYDSVSLPNNENVRAAKSQGYILTYAQVLFTLAEGALKGWIAADPKVLYEAGIRASFKQWDVFNQTAYDNYIAHPDVVYSPANAERLIGEQKWISLYMQGYEAWAEWRRTGFPNFLVPPANPMNDSGQIPRRQGYPASEAANNSANYEEAVQRQGADDLDTRVWWDK